MVDYRYLRNLDIDDLIILSSLLDPYPLVNVARELRITPPALSHRIKKYKTHIPNFDIVTKAVTRELSPETRLFCLKAKQALGVLGLTDTMKQIR